MFIQFEGNSTLINTDAIDSIWVHNHGDSFAANFYFGERNVNICMSKTIFDQLLDSLRCSPDWRNKIDTEDHYFNLNNIAYVDSDGIHMVNGSVNHIFNFEKTMKDIPFRAIESHNFTV